MYITIKQKVKGAWGIKNRQEFALAQFRPIVAKSISYPTR